MLTTARVRELKPQDKVYEVTCAAVAGFVVRVLPSGKKVFLVRHQVDGKWRREKIGQMSPTLGVDEARRQALLMLGGEARSEAAVQPVARRSAPKSVRRVEPVKQVESRRVTVRELADRFVREYVDVYLKPGTAAAYRRHLEAHVLPRLGDRDFESVTRSDVQALHASLKHIKGSANYSVCIVGSLYSRIIDDWKLSSMPNPNHKIRLFKMKTRERFLTPEERRHVEEVLLRGLQISPGRKGHLDRMGVWALQLLSLTGLRRDEIRDLTWPMVDWQHSCLNLPDTKTGQRSIQVPSHVITLLRRIHDHTGNRKVGLVITSRTGRKLSGLNLTWKRIREAVGIPDVRLHDLRHSFASDALMGGVPLAIVGEMLGHRQPSTTKRYAHLANRVVREALEHTADRIVEASKPLPALPVAPFEPLRDVQWAAIVTLVNADRSRGGRPVDLRDVVNGIRWVLHTQGHWSDIPATYASTTACWRWYKRWCADETWSKVEAAIAAPSAGPARRPRPRARPKD
ncbi:tyrosine-type recombinase/integrase [Nannocystis sp.]|uniref:tyrosine-type recombinase/integrase n=1 Tax=Nannocystis sp. TaxID=1962667 RepID=UPI0025EA9815|nr:tyrosine-type recombinase/integrase [Nannocystis sp.]MBK7829341.1 tyrosine-type recombinase/integrase [Nannocystis sp.]